MRTVTEEQFVAIKEDIAKLPNASAFTKETEIYLVPLKADDRGSNEFAESLKSRFEKEGHTNVSLESTMYVGSIPNTPYQVTEGLPPVGFPFIHIHPFNG